MPKCQAAARAAWLAERQAELPPVPCFHVVLTLPPAAAEIAFHIKQAVYGLLTRAAAQALTVLVAKRFGAKIGLIAVLHTWGRTPFHHPHVRCLVPGGGVAPDGRRWVACKPNFARRVVRSALARFGLDGDLFVAHGAQIPAAQRSNRSTIANRRRRDTDPRAQNQNRRCAFPITANRSAPSFNPAYARSPFATPHIPAGDLT